MWPLIIGAVSQQQAYDPDLAIYFDSLTTPLSTAQKNRLNTLILAWKAGLGIRYLYEFFDLIYIMANETAESALRNIVKRQHDATSLAMPSFTAFKGYQGNDNNMYLNTNYNPLSDAINYKLNDSAIGIYQRALGTRGNDFVLGAYSGGDGLITMNETGIYTRLHSYQQSAIPYALGMNIMSRPSPFYFNFYRNNEEAIISEIASTTIPNCNLYLFCYNNNGTPHNFSDVPLSLVFTSKSITNQQRLFLRNSFNNYMTDLGKQV